MKALAPILRPLRAVLAVLMLHILALWGLQTALLRPVAYRPDAARPSRVLLRLLPAVPAPTPLLRADASARDVDRSGSGNARRPAPLRRSAAPTAVAVPEPATLAHPQPQAHVSAEPTPTPELSGASEPLIETAAIRRAIREAALGEGSMAQQAVAATAALRAPSANERLSKHIGQAGRGDCSRGGYAGAGMGLLSLPFLAAAALRDECAN